MSPFSMKRNDAKTLRRLAQLEATVAAKAWEEF
jgi:hypothetical protein